MPLLDVSCLSISCRLVVETVTPLEKERRAYRLVGGVLVEQTVEEILPYVLKNRDGVSPAGAKRSANAF